MDLLSKNNIKELLEKHNTKLDKKLGQNFLISESVLNKFVKATNIQPNDNIFEIGPGIGTITQELIKQTKNVTVIEKDPKMCEILKDLFNIKIVNQDILDFLIPEGDYKVIGNLPFYITSPIIRMFLENKNQPKEMIFITQKEVAERICAKPPKMNILAVLVQMYSNPKIVSHISKEAFYPKPKVDSSIIQIIPFNTELNQELFLKIVKAGFSHPRKQLINNFSNSFSKEKTQIQEWLLKNNIQPNQRAESLDIKTWINLTESYSLVA